jgi:hypothetical protein
MWKTCAFLALAIAAALLAGCFGDDSDDPGLIGGLIQASQQAEAQQQAQAEAMAQQMEQQMRQQMEAEMSGKPLPQPAAPAASAPPGMTGVPECDDYLVNYPRCVQSSAPAMAKASMMQGFEAQKQAWLEMAKTPETRMSLQVGCQVALTQGKTAMRMYGCDWK